MIDHSLDAHLSRHVDLGGPLAAEVATTVRLLAETGVAMAATIAEGPLGRAFAEQQGAVNSDGDVQRGLDVLADERFLGAISDSPVALYAAEELAEPVLVAGDRPLALAIDPLDGSSNTTPTFRSARSFRSGARSAIRSAIRWRASCATGASSWPPAS